jgi:hypothetical protein
MVKAISLGTSTYWPMSPRLVAPMAASRDNLNGRNTADEVAKVATIYGHSQCPLQLTASE